MKLKQVLLFTLCITFFGCSSESDGEPNPNPDSEDSTLIKRIVYNGGTEYEYTETFNYDGNKLTSLDYGDDTKNIYTYNNGNLVKDDYFLEGILQASTSLQYNSNGKLSTYIETFYEASGLGDRKYKHNIVYNNDDTITNEVYVSFSGSDFELDYTETITLNKKNITKIADNEENEINYSYDTKNGVFKNIYAIEVLNILSENEFGALIYGNTNNVTSYIESDSDSSDNYNDRYEYVYNDKDYPKTGIYTSEYGTIDEDIETLEYFYE